MRKAELLERLSKYGPDDVIGIGIHLGNDEYDTQPIDHVIEGQGIALLATPPRDKYKAVWE